MANITGYVSKKLTANILAQSVTLDVNGFYLISNTSANVVTINLDNLVTEEGAIELAAGQSLENFKEYCKVLHYNSAADGSVLKIIGKRENM